MVIIGRLGSWRAVVSRCAWDCPRRETKNCPRPAGCPITTPEPPPPPPKTEEKKPEEKKRRWRSKLRRHRDPLIKRTASSRPDARRAGGEPSQFDTENSGKLFSSQGTLRADSLRVFDLAREPTDERGIACVPPKVSKKPPTERPRRPVASIWAGRSRSPGGTPATFDLPTADRGNFRPADGRRRDKIIETSRKPSAPSARSMPKATTGPSIILEPATQSSAP